MKLLFALYLIFFSIFSYSHHVYFRDEQGWSKKTRDKAYHRTEGSQLMPLNWFLNLRSSRNNRKILDQIEKYGLLRSDADKRENPYGLPIGFSVDDDAETASLYGERKWVGLNCMACHTGMIKVGYKKVIIEGGTSMIDFHKFQYDILDGVEKIIDNPLRFQKFARDVKSQDNELLRNYVKAFRNDFKDYLVKNHSNQKGKRYHFGPSLIDGLANPTNDVSCNLNRLSDPILKSLITFEANCLEANAPTSIPHLWGIHSIDRAQYAGDIHSIAGRNLGQSVGVFGKNWVERKANGGLELRTSADLEGLDKLEEWAGQLRAPSWEKLSKKGYLPRINKRMAAKGRAIYESECLSCHALKPEIYGFNQFGVSSWKQTQISVDEIGTDPMVIETDERKRKLPSLFLNAFKKELGEDSVDQNNNVSSQDYRTFAVRALIKDLFERENYNDFQKLDFLNCRTQALSPEPVRGYKARTLDGIAFSAPYLHNGSVPTLYDLLKPAHLRPKKFYLGCHRFNPWKVGYRCGPYSRNSYLYDTREFAKSNSGHEYGTHLKHKEKRQLIEFLKTIESPKEAPTAPQSPCFDSYRRD